MLLLRRAAQGAIHLEPENALAAFETLGGGTLLPVHWGTYKLALHDWDEPAETLLRLADERGSSPRAWGRSSSQSDSRRPLR